LELEITEGVLVENVTQTSWILNRLKEMGVKISIDDFGTGYSSMSYLKNFPTDTLKIDQSFIRGITSNTEDDTIVSAVINLSHTLNLRVIAEGVETLAHLEKLEEKGCDEAQGYLFSKPVPPDELQETFPADGLWLPNTDQEIKKAG